MMTNRNQPPYPPEYVLLRAAPVLLALFLFAALSVSATAQATEPIPPEAFPSAWKNLSRSITPFSIDVAIFARTEHQTMSQFAHIYIEFPDAKHIYQYAAFKDPLPFEYKAFSSDGMAIVHDLKTDSFSYFPSRILPVSIFSLQESAESFFRMVRFEAIEPEIFEQQQTYVMKVSIDPMNISPGVILSDIMGHLWINSKTVRPVRFVVMGKAGIMDAQQTQTSLLVDFHYRRMTLDTDGWKKVDAAMKDFENDSPETGEATVRKIEKRMLEVMSEIQSEK